MFEVSRERTTENYKVLTILPTTTGNMVAVELTAEEALVLADELKKNAEIIMDEVYNMPVVPRKVKALIDCGKVRKLEYSSQAKEADTGCTLYQIRAVFSDGTSRMYYYSCKFFENDDLLRGQLEYIKNIPIVFKDKESMPYGVETVDGVVGYNLNNISDKEEDIDPNNEISTNIPEVDLSKKG